MAMIQTAPPQAHWRRLLPSSQDADSAECAVAAILATPPLDELEGQSCMQRTPDVIVRWARRYPIWLPCLILLSHLGPIARLKVER
jgi:hypothetical protein